MPMKVNKMKRIGIVSYNMHYNYSNYGSILQTYAMQEAIKLYSDDCTPVVIDYCPDNFFYSNPKNPLGLAGDIEQMYKQQNIDLKAVIENENKIQYFFHTKYNLSSHKYNSFNFNDSLEQECLAGYVCGSDAIWSIEYFKGFDRAYYASHPCMHKKSIAYAASFGETIFNEVLRAKMLSHMRNFNAIGLRESIEINTINMYTDIPVMRVLDPTLLIPTEMYKSIMRPQIINEPYLLLYSRRYNQQMNDIAKEIAGERGLAIIDISLYTNNDLNCKNQYCAGVEEFLSLVYYSQIVITNSLHGTIFSILMNKDFFVFSRIHGDRKIDELLSLLDLESRKVTGGNAEMFWNKCINYIDVSVLLDKYRKDSINFLKMALKHL